MKIEIPDADLKGFNQQAKDEFKKSLLDFSNDLICESNNIESATNPDSKVTQIISSMVHDANTFLRRKLVKSKRKPWNVFFKLMSAVFILLSGIMYQTDKLKNAEFYLAGYIVIIALATLFTVISFKND